MPRKVMVLHRWQVVTAFVAITAAFVVMGVILKSQQDAIQQSRVTSCQKTYESFRDVFSPFFQPPAKRTVQQQHDIDKFNRIIDKKKAGCGRQTKP
jgi:mannitol-specific phosphotransferase system IIBC component